MNRNQIVYWSTTGLLVVPMTFGGLGDLSGAMADGLAHLGYPPILGTILGVWKVLGVVALLAPGLPRLKEWAYAGFVFTVTGAAVSHLAAGDGVGGAMPPLVLLVLALGSWASRPASRRLGEIVPVRGHGAAVTA